MVGIRPLYRGVLLAAVVLLGLGLTASVARAACVSSTPTGAVFPDSPTDGSPAPEITDVRADIDSWCRLTLDPAIAQGTLVLGEAVEVYLDTDGNGATGSPEFSGADRTVVTFAGLPPVMAGWGGADFDFFNAVPLPPAGVAGFRVGINQLGMPGPATLGLMVVSSHDDRLGSVYLDSAPEPLSPPFYLPVDFSAGQPTSPASASPSPAAPRAPAPLQQSKQECLVPRVRGLRVGRAVRRLRRAGCRYRVRGRGRVRWTAPRAGARTTKRVLVRAKRGR